MKNCITLLLCFVNSLTLFAASLPRIDLHYTLLACDTFNAGSFRFNNETDTFSFCMKIRHRGASSSSYDKPSYAIKLVDDKGNSIDGTFLDMRSDNYWILDAMACDKARMRNRVSMDLWLEISHQPWYKEQEPKCINGYRGKMVVVYVNGQNNGIYHFMERVDRKQLKLKKYSDEKGIRGVLYNSIHWGGTAKFSAPTTEPSNTNDTWDSWELKYPDLEDGEPITWNPLYDLISFVNFTDSATFADSIAEKLDLPVFVDYILFCQLLSARDNEAKNTYLSFYDDSYQHALYTPWDLDHSWGRQYDGTDENTDYILFDGHKLADRLSQDYPHFNDILDSRWKELRQHFFTVEHIDTLFEPYFTLYNTTGMDTIEQQLWSGHNDLYFNIASEQSYIHQWLSDRINYLDFIYHYTYTTTPIESQYSSISSNIFTKIYLNGHLYIQCGNSWYDLLGSPTLHANTLLP